MPLKVNLEECRKRIENAAWFALVFKNSQVNITKIFPGDITRRSGNYYVDFTAKEYSALSLPNEECEIILHCAKEEVEKI